MHSIPVDIEDNEEPTVKEGAYRVWFDLDSNDNIEILYVENEDEEQISFDDFLSDNWSALAKTEEEAHDQIMHECNQNYQEHLRDMRMFGDY